MSDQFAVADAHPTNRELVIPAQMKTEEKRLYRTIARQILELINSGEYQVGNRLPAERVLAERFGVSRPTIREAIIALEAKGYLEVKTGSGVFVIEREAKLSGLDGGPVSPFELIEARVFIEGEAAALAAVMITPDQLQQLADALAEMAKENTELNQGSTIADQTFHRIISEAANNRILSMYIAQLWDVQEQLDHIKKAHADVCMEDAPRRLEEHKAIYAALSKRDPAAARAAMRNHFSRILNALHDTNEQIEVSEVHRKLSEIRERFSTDRLLAT